MVPGSKVEGVKRSYELGLWATVAVETVCKCVVQERGEW